MLTVKTGACNNFVVLQDRVLQLIGLSKEFSKLLCGGIVLSDYMHFSFLGVDPMGKLDDENHVCDGHLVRCMGISDSIRSTMDVEILMVLLEASVRDVLQRWLLFAAMFQRVRIVDLAHKDLEVYHQCTDDRMRGIGISLKISAKRSQRRVSSGRKMDVMPFIKDAYVVFDGQLLVFVITDNAGHTKSMRNTKMIVKKGFVRSNRPDLDMVCFKSEKNALFPALVNVKWENRLLGEGDSSNVQSCASYASLWH